MGKGMYHISVFKKMFDDVGTYFVKQLKVHELLYGVKAKRMTTRRAKAIRKFWFQDAVTNRQKEDKSDGDAYKSGTYMEHELEEDDDEV